MPHLRTAQDRSAACIKRRKSPIHGATSFTRVKERASSGSMNFFVGNSADHFHDAFGGFGRVSGSIQDGRGRKR